MNLFRTCLRPLLFRCDPERIHGQTIAAAERLGRWSGLCGFLDGQWRITDPRLAVTIAGIRFDNPVGLAAGFDKNGRAIDLLGSLGFGFVEIGSVSAEPSSGNPRPRLFRLPEDEAIVVNYGVPNDGAAVIARRVARRRSTLPVGVNLVETNTGRASTLDEVIGQFQRAARPFLGLADYFALNLNCPNTNRGKSTLDDPANLARLLSAFGSLPGLPPVFLKVTATADLRRIDGILNAAGPHLYVLGFIFNAAAGKPPGLRTPQAELATMPGAVCGRPLRATLHAALRAWRKSIDPRRFHLIGVGGIFDAEDAYAAICLGATAVQLYTGLIYRGPGIVRTINEGLLRLLDGDGLRSLAEAVGVRA